MDNCFGDSDPKRANSVCETVKKTKANLVSDDPTTSTKLTVPGDYLNNNNCFGTRQYGNNKSSSLLVKPCSNATSDNYSCIEHNYGNSHKKEQLQCLNKRSGEECSAQTPKRLKPSEPSDESPSSTCSSTPSAWNELSSNQANSYEIPSTLGQDAMSILRCLSFDQQNNYSWTDNFQINYTQADYSKQNPNYSNLDSRCGNSFYDENYSQAISSNCHFNYPSSESHLVPYMQESMLESSKIDYEPSHTSSDASQLSCHESGIAPPPTPNIEAQQNVDSSSSNQSDNSQVTMEQCYMFCPMYSGESSIGSDQSMNYCYYISNDAKSNCPPMYYYQNGPQESSVSSVDSQPQSKASTPVHVQSPQSYGTPQSTNKVNVETKKVCGTYTASGEKIRRPPNAFMIFAKERRREILYSNQRITNKEVSKRLGVEWRNLPEETRARYQKLSEELRQEHQLKYPGRNRWGRVCYLNIFSPLWRVWAITH